MTTIAQPRARGYAVAAAVAALAVALSLGSARALWPDSPGADVNDPARPMWFAPIADSYHQNPKVGPSFRFADLYSGDPAWFGPVAEYYGFTPGVTSASDFASLYGVAGAGTTP